MQGASVLQFLLEVPMPLAAVSAAAVWVVAAIALFCVWDGE